ncbi:hypothetical protein PXO_00025 [Xanthomonas oryzae pv. oryzae PXO99A]|uniref:Uncharacterized protein n=1 Tax=Xanthomonas oryzae pv. oryzae (strain PXO99A) TaxID=360094 RepID=A0A0K0GJA4_XANOP|nr:hypothetical protein PXO_00025 [Xanthomonas oryzae pv. oryzae PXO99A]
MIDTNGRARQKVGVLLGGSFRCRPRRRLDGSFGWRKRSPKHPGTLA